MFRPSLQAITRTTKLKLLLRARKVIYVKYTYVLYIMYTRPDDGLQWRPKHVAVVIKIKVLYVTEML